MAEIKRSLYQPFMLGGIERKYAIIFGIIFLIILFYGFPSWSAIIIGESVVCTIWAGLADMNRRDYLMLTILNKYRYQQKHYLAHALETKVKPHQRKDFNVR